MSTVPVNPGNAEHRNLPPTIQRHACYLQSQGQALFAWIHSPLDSLIKNHGVVICPPLGYEQIHAHRTLKHLADSLALEGYLVCRFDYHGTGDSAGIDEDPNRYATWLTNIRDVLSWMKEQLGCEHLSIIGLRLGASLALQTAGEFPIDQLVLWSPVTKGRQYVREMQALGRTSSGSASPISETEDIEAAGFILTRQTVEEVNKLDGMKIHPRCQKLLIVAREDLSEDRRLVDHLSGLGIDAQQIRVPGYVDMMAEPHSSKVPIQAISQIVEWMNSVSQEDTSRDNDLNLQAIGSTKANIPYTPISNQGHDRTRFLEEQIVSLPGPRELVGILSQPEHPYDPERPLIVLLNAGSAYRVGPNRLYLLLTRELAAKGFRSLRMDLGGLGDSQGTFAPDQKTDPYSATIFRDIDATLHYAQDHLGARKIIVMGLCSGAYFTFQTAVQFSNESVIENISINPLTYFWKEGMTVHDPGAKELLVFHYYSQSARQPSKWWKLITGRSRIGWVGAFKMLANRWLGRGKSRERNHTPLSKSQKDAEIAHPQQNNLSADLNRAIQSGRRIAFFFSSTDPGHSILTYHAKREVKSFCREGKVHIQFIDDADHTFSRRHPRQTAIQAIVQYLVDRYPTHSK